MINAKTLEALAQFYKRLQVTRQDGYDLTFFDFVSRDTLRKQLDFMLARNKDIDRALMNLKAGGCYEIGKDTWGLERTMNVLKTAQGEYMLMLETKSKLCDHTVSQPSKSSIHKRSGYFKVGKPAWRIDGELLKYFHLIYEFEDPAKDQKVKTEVEASQIFGENTLHVLAQQLGGLKTKNGKQRRSMYAPAALGTLGETMSSIQCLGLEDRYSLIKGLLIGAQTFYDLGYCHGDIHTQNVLLMNSNGSFYLTLSDCGSCGKVNSISNAGGAYERMPPESIAYYENIVDKNRSTYKEYHKIDKAFYSHNIYQAEKKTIVPQDPYICSQSKEMWIIGTIAHSILYNALPSLLESEKVTSNPLLEGLLRLDPSERLTAEQALEVCEQQLNNARGSSKMACERMQEYVPYHIGARPYGAMDIAKDASVTSMRTLQDEDSEQASQQGSEQAFEPSRCTIL